MFFASLPAEVDMHEALGRHQRSIAETSMPRERRASVRDSMVLKFGGTLVCKARDRTLMVRTDEAGKAVALEVASVGLRTLVQKSY